MACATRKEVRGSWRALLARKKRVAGLTLEIQSLLQLKLALRQNVTHLNRQFVFLYGRCRLTSESSGQPGFPCYGDPCWTFSRYHRVRQLSSSLELPNSPLWLYGSQPWTCCCKSSFRSCQYPMMQCSLIFRVLTRFFFYTWVSLVSEKTSLSLILMSLTLTLSLGYSTFSDLCLNAEHFMIYFDGYFEAEKLDYQPQKCRF